MIDKIKRLKQSLDSETDVSVIKTIKAVIAGMGNYHLGLNYNLAKQRFEDHCKSCKFNELEPIESMKIEDKSVPELSNKICSHCGGCTLSYKLRQNVKPCEFWV